MHEIKAIAVLLALLQDKDSDVRLSAAETLGNIGKDNPQAIAALLSLLKDKNYDLRWRAARALSNIGKDNPEAITLMANWINEHQDTEYVGNGIDVLWNLVTDDD